MNQTDDDTKLYILFLSFKDQQMYLKNQMSNNSFIDAITFWYMSNLFEEFSCNLFHLLLPEVWFLNIVCHKNW